MGSTLATCWSRKHSPGCCIVSKPVWVGFGDLSELAVMAEQGAQSRGRDAPSPGGAFEIDEQRRTAVGGPLQEHVVIQELQDFGSQRQTARFTTLAVDAQLRFRQQQIIAVEGAHFARTQAIEEH